MNRTLALLVLSCGFTACIDGTVTCPDGSVASGGRCLSPDAGALPGDPDAGPSNLDAAPDVPPDAGMPAIALVNAPSWVRARAGVEAVLEVEIARTDFDGAVTLSLSGLPPGTASSPVELAGDATTATLELTSAASAVGVYEIVLIASAPALPPIETPLELYVAGRPGQLDTTFGEAGTATLEGEDLSLGGITLDPSGGIITVSNNATEPLVVRFANDGTLDPEFGDGGVIRGPSLARASQVVADEAGFQVLYNTFVRAYDMQGAVRSGFGIGGDSDPPGYYWEMTQSREGLIVYSQNSPPAAIDPSGDLVETFAPDWGLDLPFSIVASDGEVSFDRNGVDEYVVQRVDIDGSPAMAFGVGGRASVPSTDPGDTTVRLSVPLTDGSVFVGGVVSRWSPRSSRAEVFRLTSSGTIDTTFGGPRLFSSAGGIEEMHGVGDDGGVVVLGWDWDAAFEREQPVVRRYLHDGSLDAEFGVAGELPLWRFADGAGEVVGPVGTMDIDPRTGRMVVCGTPAPRTSVECRRYWL